MNDHQISHIKQVKEPADFACHTKEEVAKNVSEHIIQNLNTPIEESKRHIESFTKMAMDKSEEHERYLEGQRDHRQARFFFLSRTRDECEAELLEAKIVVLSEDNTNLKAQHEELARTNNMNKEQVITLLKEKVLWQEKCLQLMLKRPRDEDEQPESAKRTAEDGPKPAPVTSADNEMSTAEDAHDTSHTLNTSRENITSDTLNTSRENIASNTSLPPPPWREHRLPASSHSSSVAEVSE
jgi:hypothetical protein